MSKKVAVMDLGTNTFHLLIAEGDASNPNTLLQITEPVKLGEGGINKGVIQPAAFERGILAMQQFHQHILKHNVDQVKAIATSALRNAANGKDFIDEVKAKTSIIIEIIDGEEEAAYIYKGVKAGGCLSSHNSLIVDIGGGSVECILRNENAITWKQSFEIGAARLMDAFHQTDPISVESINNLNTFLEDRLIYLLTATSGYTITDIIGSSGAFETFATLIELQNENAFELKKIKKYSFKYPDFLSVTDQLIHSSHQERANNSGIISIRVDMIVVAALLTRFIMKKLDISTIIMSTNSLKEGILANLLE
jgi:exopolyphosphatase/guanosine-5'-triphosphate,3'-diphosphate pyrophosphatase